MISQWGSAALFELAPATSAEGEWSATIPLHLRYLTPAANTSGLTEVDVPWPVVFWACEAEEGLKFATSPFDRVNLGYEGLFGPKTLFRHLTPALPGSRGGAQGQSSAVMVEALQVPVLDLDRVSKMETGTVAAIVLGLIWMIWTLVRPITKREGKVDEKEKKRA